MGLGFEYAGRSGISFGKDDLIVPKEKTLVQKRTKRYLRGVRAFVSGRFDYKGEKHNKLVDAWSKCTEDISKAMMESVAANVPGKSLNSLYLMAWQILGPVVLQHKCVS